VGNSFRLFTGFVVGFFLMLAGCEQWQEPIAEIRHGDEELMTMSSVTAADYGGTLPVNSILCPDAGEKVKAEDIRGPVAALLAQAKEVGVPLHYVFAEVPLTPFVVGPPNTFSGNTWTDSKITLDVPSAKIDDEIEVHAWGNWQLNASSSPGDVAGRARIEIIEDVNGAPLIVPNIIGMATIYDDGGSLTLPHNEPWHLAIRHVVTANGDARITVQIRSEDLTGGAGTATLILMFSARMDVKHTKHS
jgi:hypothetical protein